MDTLSPAATWHGTAAEWGDLWLAIEAHCDCTYDLLVVQAAICAAHLMLTQQRILDHLIHCRRLRAWFVDNEFCTAWPRPGECWYPVARRTPTADWGRRELEEPAGWQFTDKTGSKRSR